MIDNDHYAITVQKKTNYITENSEPGILSL